VFGFKGKSPEKRRNPTRKEKEPSEAEAKEISKTPGRNCFSYCGI